MPCEGSLTPAIAAATVVLLLLLILLLLVKSSRGRQLLIKLQNRFKLNVLIMDSATDSAKSRGEAQVFGTTTMTHASMVTAPKGRARARLLPLPGARLAARRGLALGAERGRATALAASEVDRLESHRGQRVLSTQARPRPAPRAHMAVRAARCQLTLVMRDAARALPAPRVA